MKKALLMIAAGALMVLAGCSKEAGYPMAPLDGNYYTDAMANVTMPQDDEPQPGQEEENIPAENPFVKVSEAPTSTFSVDADGASYAYMRRCITGGNLPFASMVRTEEFLNYFTFDYADPAGDESVSINAEIGICPWDHGHRLLRLGLKGKSLSDNEIPPANFIFLIDTSGSMMGADRIDLLKSGLCNLVDQLKPTDRVAIITYSGSVSMALESTLVKDPAAIKKVIRKLEASGSTAGGAAMKMAYEEASEHYMPNGNNRIIMCTDGDFNVGVSSTDELVKMVESYQEKGIYLSIMGFGIGNYQDYRMENLSNHGNGTYTYIDCEDEMMKVFVHERSHFVAVANDTKCQISFTDAVDSYRLIGYENRVMDNEDFEDDTKDAGEIGAGQTVTALYELIPAEGFTTSAKAAVFDVRYKKALGAESRPLSIDVTVPDDSFVNTPDYYFAAGLAAFSLVLKESEYKGQSSYTLAYNLVSSGSASAADPLKLRPQLLQLIDSAQKIANKSQQQ